MQAAHQSMVIESLGSEDSGDLHKRIPCSCGGSNECALLSATEDFDMLDNICLMCELQQTGYHIQIG